MKKKTSSIVLSGKANTKFHINFFLKINVYFFVFGGFKNKPNESICVSAQCA